MYGADYFDTTDLAIMHFGNAQTKIIEECTCTNTNFCFFLFKSFSDHVISGLFIFIWNMDVQDAVYNPCFCSSTENDFFRFIKFNKKEFSGCK